jgi:MFS transporter, PPP family, 3-phenylpropionic acid transporter
MPQVIALQFLSFAARGFILPFIALYLISQGFSKTEVGLLLSAGAAVQLFITPWLNTQADRRGQHRMLYYALVFGSALATLGFVLPLGKAWFVLMYLIRDLCDMPNATLLSQLTLTWLQGRGQAIYGRLRSFGSLGWAITTLVSGTLSRIAGYPLLFFLASVINFFILPFIRQLPPHIVSKQVGQVRVARTQSFKLLLLALFPFYIGATALNSFIYVFFAEELGVSNDHIGALISLGAFCEIPAMFALDYFVRRFNAYFALLAGMIGMVGLMLMYSIIQNPILLIPMVILRGVFFTLSTISLVLLIPQVSNQGNVGTNQALAQVTLVSVATALTGFFSGAIFDTMGGRSLFQIGAAISIIGIGILIVMRRYVMSPVSQPVVEREIEPVNA